MWRLRNFVLTIKATMAREKLHSPATKEHNIADGASGTKLLELRIGWLDFCLIRVKAETIKRWIDQRIGFKRFDFNCFLFFTSSTQKRCFFYFQFTIVFVVVYFFNHSGIKESIHNIMDAKILVDLFLHIQLKKLSSNYSVTQLEYYCSSTLGSLQLWHLSTRLLQTALAIGFHQLLEHSED